MTTPAQIDSRFVRFGAGLGTDSRPTNLVGLSNDVLAACGQALSLVRDKLMLPATVLHTNPAAASLNAAIAALSDGDILEVDSSAIYDPITIPANKALIIRAAKGRRINLTGTGCIKLSNGTRNCLIAGAYISECSSASVNDQGAGITFAAHQTIVNDVTFYDCCIDHVLTGSGVMLSYHWSVGGDFYYTANTLPECSTNIRFFNCHFARANADNTEGGAITLRGCNRTTIYGCHFRDTTTSMRQVNLQNSQDFFIARNFVQCKSTYGANCEGIKIDEMGTCSYRSNGYVVANVVANAIEGIDIDDKVDAAVLDNVCYESMEEGISVDDSATAIIFNNICFNARYDANAAGVRVENGAVVVMGQNNCFGNSTDYRIQNGYVLPASNISDIAAVASWPTARMVPYMGTIPSVYNVKDALESLYAVRPKFESRTLTAGEIAAKQITLAAAMSAAGQIQVTVYGGLTALLGVDYSCPDTTHVSWNGLFLDGVLEAGDVLLLVY